MAATRLLKLGAVPFSLAAGLRPARAVILAYHMVSGRFGSDFDLDPSVFVRQMELLASRGRIVPLPEALRAAERPVSREGPAVALTFDDAYRDFYTTVYPVLKRLQLPATLFVPVGFLSEPTRYPVRPAENANSFVEPCTWQMLEELSRSGIVRIGSHGVSHRPIPALSPREQEWELRASRDTLEGRLGVPVRDFAWPKGYWSPESESIARCYYERVLRFAGGSLRGRTLRPERLPRVPVRRSDGPAAFRLKQLGLGDGEEALRIGLWFLLGGSEGLRR